MAKAYELGAAWFWVMDDDVAVLPDAIAKLAKWTDKHEVIQAPVSITMAARSTGSMTSLCRWAFRIRLPLPRRPCQIPCNEHPVL